MGLWEAMSYTPYGSPMEFYAQLSSADADQIGLCLIEDDSPGSNFETPI